MLATQADLVRDAQPVQVVVDGPEQLPPLPAAAEVAVYHIVQEGLTNVVRHARARTCVVRLTVADEVGTGEEAVTRARALQPDVVLMDLRMPGLDGIEATRRIVQDSPHIAVLALTMLEDDDSVFAAMRAGARGYLLKGTLKAEMLRAIQGVASGEAIFGPAIARRLMQYFATARPPGLAQTFPELTEREGEILVLIAQGRTNPEIAERLCLSLKTVRNHVSNIFSKLQVADRAQAVVRAREAGLG